MMSEPSVHNPVGRALLFLLFVGTLALLAWSHPFLIYPFDVYILLETMEYFQQNPEAFPHVGKYYWIYAWAKFFNLIFPDGGTIFQKARVIHAIQSLYAFCSVFYASYVVAGRIFKKDTPLMRGYVAYWGALLWVLVFATASVGQHRIWLQWYSVNYQIALPTILLAFALIIRLLFEPMGAGKRLFLALTAAGLVATVAVIHSMELIYLSLYLLLLLLLFFDRLLQSARRHPVVTLVVLAWIGGGAYVFHHWILPELVHRKIVLLEYLGKGDWQGLLAHIERDGRALVARFNRAWASVNVVYYVAIGWIGLATLAAYWFRQDQLAGRWLLFLLAASLLAWIPLYIYPAGVASLITHIFVVNRFYYASWIFLALPAGIYALLRLIPIKRRMVVFNVLMVLTVAAMGYVSWRFDRWHHNFYKNLVSAYEMFDPKRVGFQLDQAEREAVDRALARYARRVDLNGTTIFAREDIAFYLKYVHRLPHVYLKRHYNGRKLDTRWYRQAYRRFKGKKLLFEVPSGVGEYQAYCQ